MSIIIGSDHAGLTLKKEIIKYLQRKKKNVIDVGTKDKNPVDYPDIAKKVVKKVKNRKHKGILICGTGTGMVIAANRTKGIRATVAYDTYSAKMARQDNNANILCLRGRFFPHKKAKQIVHTWLHTLFSNKKRHKRRISKLDQK